MGQEQPTPEQIESWDSTRIESPVLAKNMADTEHDITDQVRAAEKIGLDAKMIDDLKNERERDLDKTEKIQTFNQQLADKLILKGLQGKEVCNGDFTLPGDFNCNDLEAFIKEKLYRRAPNGSITDEPKVKGFDYLRTYRGMTPDGDEYPREIDNIYVGYKDQLDKRREKIRAKEEFQAKKLLGSRKVIE